MTDEKNKQMPWKKYHLRLSMYSDDDILTFKGHIDTSKPDPRLGTFLENGYFITEKEAEEFMRLREDKLAQEKFLSGYFRFSCLKCGLVIPEKDVDITIPVVMYTCPTCHTKAQWRIVCS